MTANYELKTEEDKEGSKEVDNLYDIPETPKQKSSLPMVAGILLIIAGIFAIIFWTPFFSVDMTTIEDAVNISQFKQIDPDINAEEILGFFRTCATIGIILSIFPILGGILAIRRKLFGISIACSIIGLFSFGMFISSIFSLIALIILIFVRKEY